MTYSKFKAFSMLCAEMLEECFGISDAQYPAAALRDEDLSLWLELREAAGLAPKPVAGFSYRVVDGIVEVV